MISRRKIVAGLIVISGIIFMFLLFLIGFILHEQFGASDEELSGTSVAPPWFVRISFAIFIFMIGWLFGLFMVWYYFPEIRPKNRNGKLSATASPYDVVIYISKPEEVKVIEAVRQLGNKAYQFEIARYCNLSRMKVHRIIQRLAERGIIQVEKQGKHRKISLSEWMNPVSGENS